MTNLRSTVVNLTSAVDMFLRDLDPCCYDPSSDAILAAQAATKTCKRSTKAFLASKPKAAAQAQSAPVRSTVIRAQSTISESSGEQATCYGSASVLASVGAISLFSVAGVAMTLAARSIEKRVSSLSGSA